MYSECVTLSEYSECVSKMLVENGAGMTIN